MATLPTQPFTSAEKRDFRQEVTDRIIDMLEKGAAPWQKPWEPSASALGMPNNPTTEKAYRGGNAIHLMATAMRRGYDDPRWMTYKQASDQGWQVRKGEKGTQIEYWEVKAASRERGNDPADAGTDQQSEGDRGRNGRLIHRVYTVFNVRQIDGVPPYKPKEHTAFEVVHSGEQILTHSGAKISHDQADRAFYRRSSDSIHLPPKDAFQDAAGYYGTALHELAHWTGHPARLNRPTLNDTYRFGDTNYAKEELRAELASVFLAAERGIPHKPEQHAAYVGSWIAALQKDKNEIFRAAHDASAASDYLLALERDRSIADQALSAAPLLDTGTNGTSRAAAFEREVTSLERSREDLDETVSDGQSVSSSAEMKQPIPCSFKPGDQVMAYQPYYYGGKPRKDPWVPGMIQSLYNNDQYISYARAGRSENGNKSVEYAMKGEMRYPTAQEQERYSVEFSQLEEKLRPSLSRLSKAISTEPGSARESSHYVSRYEPGNATIHTEHKATGTDRRTAFDPLEPANSYDSPAATQGQASELVRGKAAGDSLSAAREITSKAMGDSALMFTALTDSGTYRGVILGETEQHIVQRQSTLSSVLHRKESLDGQPETGANVIIQYSNEKASVRELRDRVKAKELSR